MFLIDKINRILLVKEGNPSWRGLYGLAKLGALVTFVFFLALFVAVPYRRK